jgi:uncharacterized membrane protein YidH (DUF202 family)
MRVLGIILIGLGVIGLAIGGIQYTRSEKVLDVGPIEATVERERRIPIPPIAGVIAVAAGVVLLLAAGRSKA